jgi:hypothetical protein
VHLNRAGELELGKADKRFAEGGREIDILGACDEHAVCARTRDSAAYFHAAIFAADALDADTPVLRDAVNCMLCRCFKGVLGACAPILSAIAQFVNGGDARLLVYYFFLVFIKRLKDNPEVNLWGIFAKSPLFPVVADAVKSDFTPFDVLKTAVMQDPLTRMRYPNVVEFFCACFSTVPGKQRSSRP